MRGPRSRPLRAWIDRLTPVLASVVLVGLATTVAGAAESGSLVIAVVAGAMALSVLGLLVVSRRQPVLERPWDGARTVVAGRSARASRAAGGSRRVVAALGRVEARELACSPWFALGVGFQLFSFATFVVLYGHEDHDLWAEVIQQLVAVCHPLVGMVVLAAHAAATRDAHDGADELFESCPVPASTRTLALLSTAWVAALALAIFLATYLGSLAVQGPQVYGPLGRDAVPDLISAVLLGIGAVALGVAVGRWMRSRLAPVVAVVAVGAVSLRMAASGGGWAPAARLSTILPVGPEVFRHRAAWWYLGWLLGLSAIVAGLAMARPLASRGEGAASRRPLAIFAALAFSSTLISGVMVTRPMPDAAAERLTDRVRDPAAHQACASAGQAGAVCAYLGYGELRDRIVAEVTPVVAALPPGAGSVTLRQVFPGEVGDLPPEVVRRLPEGLPALPPNEVALPLESTGNRVVASRFLVALSALDLPVAPTRNRDGPRPLVVAGEARGVVALWLAAQGMTAVDANGLATAQRRGRSGPPSSRADAFERGFAWPTSCDAAPVVWSAQDLAAARTIISRPAAEVTAVVHADWARWSSPATGTDDLLAALGLAPVGPFDVVVTRDPGQC